MLKKVIGIEPIARTNRREERMIVEKPVMLLVRNIVDFLEFPPLYCRPAKPHFFTINLFSITNIRSYWEYYIHFSLKRTFKCRPFFDHWASMKSPFGCISICSLLNLANGDNINNEPGYPLTDQIIERIQKLRSYDRYAAAVFCTTSTMLVDVSECQSFNN